MVDYETFSGLRLGRIFPPDFLAEFPWYSEVGRHYDTEYLGGQWHEECIDGVRFWFPAAAGGRLGIVEVSGCPLFAPIARDRADPKAGWLVPAWTKNANQALESIDFPMRMGDKETDLCKLAAGKVNRCPFPAEWYRAAGVSETGSLAKVHFAYRVPDIYHVIAVVHASEGLLSLEIRRPDLIRKNDPSGSYDLCFGGLFDEGSAESLSCLNRHGS